MITEVKSFSGLDLYIEHTALEASSYHLILMMYGQCVYWIDEQKLILHKGDLLLIPGNISYYAKSIPTVFHSQTRILFHNVYRWPLPIFLSNQAVHAKVYSYEVAQDLVRKIEAQWQEKPAYFEVMTTALCTELLTHWCRELDRGSISTERERHVELMKGYIQTHYRERITKEELGEFIRRSPNYAATLFRTVTGQTISEVVHSHRIKAAKYMLTESELTVGEIAEYLGYADVSYFHRVFKRITGVSPAAYAQG